jgi:hypothetical protein
VNHQHETESENGDADISVNEKLPDKQSSSTPFGARKSTKLPIQLLSINAERSAVIYGIAIFGAAEGHSNQV